MHHDRSRCDKVAPRRSATFWPVATAMVIVVGVTLYMVYQRQHARRMNNADQLALRMSAPSVVQNPDDLPAPGGLQSFSNPDQAMSALLPDQMTPLNDEPARLPQPIGGVRQYALRQNDGMLTQEYALWRLRETDPAPFAEFYRRAAMKRGFLAVPAPASAPSAGSPLTLFFTRPDSAGGELGQTLVVRITPAPQGLNLLVWWKGRATCGAE